jgi:hypothetical protein
MGFCYLGMGWVSFMFFLLLLGQYMNTPDYGFDYAPIQFVDIKSTSVFKQNLENCQPLNSLNITYPFCSVATSNQLCVQTITDNNHLYDNRNDLLNYYLNNLQLCSSINKQYTEVKYYVGYIVDSYKYILKYIDYVCIVEDRKCTQRYSVGQAYFYDYLYKYVKYYKYNPSMNELIYNKDDSFSTISKAILIISIVWFFFFFILGIVISCHRIHTRHRNSENVNENVNNNVELNPLPSRPIVNDSHEQILLNTAERGDDQTNNV